MVRTKFGPDPTTYINPDKMDLFSQDIESRIYKYNFIFFDNKQWLKIFYHNYINRENFIDEEEDIDCNTTNKFSIIGEAYKLRKHKGKFEFLLYYPEFKGEYNQWEQTKYPLFESHTESTNHVDGYQSISISWNSSNWGGLEKSSPNTELNTSSSLLDGTIGPGYYYCIGKYNYTSWWDDKNIPGPNGKEVTEVYLFMKVFDFNECYITCLKKRNMISLLLLILNSLYNI